MNIDYAHILTTLYPEALWGLNNNDYATLRWNDTNADAAPSQADLDAAWPQVEYDRAYAQARRQRHTAYGQPDGADALFLQWQRGEATEQDWLDAVQAVKDAHPYPSAP